MAENQSIHCGGVIVFTTGLEFVSVVSKAGNYGFPKGKREKDETLFQTSIRELQEETGIQEKDIQFIQPESVYFDEISNKGNICVRYFLAQYKSDVTSKEFNFVFDLEELRQVSWINHKKLLSLLTLKNRPSILAKAVQFIKENVVNFDD